MPMFAYCKAIGCQAIKDPESDIVLDEVLLWMQWWHPEVVAKKETINQKENNQ